MLNKNAFEKVCEMASKENWCWRIHCGTCGHMYFRYAFKELTEEKHPDGKGWVTTGLARNQGERFKEFGPPPKHPRYTGWLLRDQAILIDIFSQASLKTISDHCKFPDWLGYLGLALLYTKDMERRKRTLTKAWLPQLRQIDSGGLDTKVSCSSQDENYILTYMDLEHWEERLEYKF